MLDTHWKFHTSWDDPDLDWVTSAKGNRSAFLDIGDQNDPDRPMILVIDYAPGSHTAPHSHATDYCSVIVRGDMVVTGKLRTVGSMRLVGAGTVYGPLLAGAEGCTVIDFFTNRSGVAPLDAPSEHTSEADEQTRRDRVDARVEALRRRRA